MKEIQYVVMLYGRNMCNHIDMTLVRISVDGYVYRCGGSNVMREMV